MMEERGFSVDHSTINRWVVHYAPQLEQNFRQKKRKPCSRWRLDETYIKVKGNWKYYYRADSAYQLAASKSLQHRLQCSR